MAYQRHQPKLIPTKVRKNEAARAYTEPTIIVQELKTNIDQ
ncbi:hypothetical protein [Lunatimonas salinarum]|nr:hypothetical protein [Lunatimonas salinarum]